MAPDVDMAGFWDERARENAAYFVENRLDYGDTDLEAFWATGPEVVASVLEVLGQQIRPTDAVVELGCGLGRLTRVLAASGSTVRALDVSGEMIRRAAELNAGLAGVTWIRCDGATFTDVADASADVVLSHVVLQHVPSAEITYSYVRDMGRILRPGGWAGFQVSNDPSVHHARTGPAAWKQRALAAIGRAPGGSDHPAWLGSAVDVGVLRRTAEEAGLEVERLTGAGTQFCFVVLRRPASGS